MTQFNTMKLKSRFSMDFSKKIPPSHETLEMPALFLLLDEVPQRCDA